MFNPSHELSGSKVTSWFTFILLLNIDFYSIFMLRVFIITFFSSRKKINYLLLTYFINLVLVVLIVKFKYKLNIR